LRVPMPSALTCENAAMTRIDGHALLFCYHSKYPVVRNSSIGVSAMSGARLWPQGSEAC
jgi:hypothetical protein